MVASNDQSVFMKPGNQQSELIPSMPNPSRGLVNFKSGGLNNLTPIQVLGPNLGKNRLLEESSVVFHRSLDRSLASLDRSMENLEPLPKMHLLVITLANANFAVSHKLLEAMHQTFQRRFANY